MDGWMDGRDDFGIPQIQEKVCCAPRQVSTFARVNVKHAIHLVQILSKV